MPEKNSSKNKKDFVNKLDNDKKQIVEPDNSIKDLIEKNIKWSQVLYEQNKKIKTRLTWMSVASWIRVFLILIPIIFAIIYAPIFLQEFWNNYGKFLGGVNTNPQVRDVLTNLSSENIADILSDLYQNK